MLYLKQIKMIIMIIIFNTVNIAPITVNDIQIKLKTDEANVIRIVNKDLITRKKCENSGL